MASHILTHSNTLKNPSISLEIAIIGSEQQASIEEFIAENHTFLRNASIPYKEYVINIEQIGDNQWSVSVYKASAKLSGFPGAGFDRAIAEAKRRIDEACVKTGNKG